jgi:hypothetical protein
MPAIQTNTGIYYKNWGTGRAVVFSRGWPLNADAWRRYILSMLVLCSAVSLVAAIANAQELELDALTSNAARSASGWWSPARAESATAPRLPIRMVELTPFDASGSIRTLSAQQTTHRVNESMDGSLANFEYFGLTLRVRNGAPSLLGGDRVSLPPGSSLSLLRAKYAIWESSLADSRSLTNANGVSVHPLLQINYAGWHLPVTLYISSLRDDDIR